MRVLVQATGRSFNMGKEGALLMKNETMRSTDSPPSAAPRGVNEPRQGWAHVDGIMALRSNQPVVPDHALDRLMIAESFSRWGIAWDEGCLDVIDSLFTKNGELVILEGKAEPLAHLKGHDQILDHVQNSRAAQADQRRHAISNVVVEQLDSSRATALAYGLVSTVQNGQMILAATVIYRGELCKDVVKGWQFETFIIGMDAYLRR
jgi:3-methyladenine DNA glycosylase/8-oxoguanine DNA glycosylase